MLTPAPQATLDELMIKKTFCLFTLLLLCIAIKAAPATMRLDYFHTGDAKHEVFSMDRVVIEPLPWPGDMTKTIDGTNLGKYFFEIRTVDRLRHVAGPRQRL